MKKYKVTGFFSSSEDIEAENKEEAIEKFEDNWNNIDDLWLSKCVVKQIKEMK